MVVSVVDDDPRGAKTYLHYMASESGQRAQLSDATKSVCVYTRTRKERHYIAAKRRAYC